MFTIHNLSQAGRKLNSRLGTLEFDAEGLLKDAEKFPQEFLKELGSLGGFRLVDLEAKAKADAAIAEMRAEQAKAGSKDSSPEDKSAEEPAPVKERKSRKSN